jgi:hypothetical protein
MMEMGDPFLLMDELARGTGGVAEICEKTWQVVATWCNARPNRVKP